MSRWMAQVGDLGLLGGLAKSRGRLALAGAGSLVVNVAVGVAIARFVNETSGSVVVNMFLTKKTQLFSERFVF